VIPYIETIQSRAKFAPNFFLPQSSKAEDRFQLRLLPDLFEETVSFWVPDLTKFRKDPLDIISLQR